MRTARHALFAACLLSGAPSARADRGALSLWLGGGATGLVVAAPDSLRPARAAGALPLVALGASWALSDALEVSAWGDFEPAEGLSHPGAQVPTPYGQVPATVTHGLSRWSGLVGMHLCFGRVLRWKLGAEVGASLSHVSNVHALDASPGGAVDWGLVLPDADRWQAEAALSFGLQWMAGDHLTFAVMPRAFALAGGGSGFGLSIPLFVEWDIYL